MEQNKNTAVANTANKTAAALTSWKDAIRNAEGKFLAISNKQEETKIELGFAAMLIESNPELQKCQPASILNAVINVARTGITLNPVLRLAHLVPRGGKCVLDFDYKGLVKILKDNGCIKDIQAIIVYGDEEFVESSSPIEKPLHRKKYAKTEAEQKKREKIGVYCSVLLPDNTVIYTQFTPSWEILKARDVSPAAKSQYSPWQKWEEQMWMKTKIRKDFKMLISGSPNSKVLAAMEVDDEAQDVTFAKPVANNAQPTSSEKASDIFGEEVAEEVQVIEETPVAPAITPNTEFDTPPSDATAQPSEVVKETTKKGGAQGQMKI